MACYITARSSCVARWSDFCWSCHGLSHSPAFYSSPAPPGSRLLAPDRPLPAPSRPPAQAYPGDSPPPGLSRSPGHSQYTGQLCNTSVYASIFLSNTSHPSGAYGPVVMGAPRSSSCGGPAASSHPIPSGTDRKPVYKAGSDPLLGIL